MPRLHLILAATGSQALLIRCGPKKWSCVFGWDRTTDTFQPGQCVKGRLEARSAALSPCGTWFAYSVCRQRKSEKGWYSDHGYSVVSRTPWLKALAFWYGYAVGQFRTNTTGLELEIKTHGEGTVMPDQTHPDWQTTDILLTPLPPPSGRYTFENWTNAGWTAISAWAVCPEDECRGVASWKRPHDVHRIQFEKPIRGTRWTLCMSHWCGSHNDDYSRKDSHRGLSFETFLLRSACGKVRQFPDWACADHDTFRHRIVFIQDQQLWAMDFVGNELGDPRLLLDLTGTAGWKRVAPY